ncbi:hypothetical protein G9A89_015684 [Geosiphon pyriformis]|nr:hypothetical protein G9A89_015684 [Geosiphon pyriformis]
MGVLREDLINSAVKFLKDANIQKHSLQSKLSFLESKGMTSEEIEEALRQAKGSPPSKVTTMISPQPTTQLMVPTGQAMYPSPPPVTRMDWRDYFIAAIFVGGLGYAIVTVAKRYLGPLLRTPTAKELENDKKALGDQFTTTSERLDLVKADSDFVRKHIEELATHTRESLVSLDNVLKELKQQESKRDTDIEALRKEVDHIKSSIPEFLNNSKESYTKALFDLQNELKSLKSLLLNRQSSNLVAKPSIGEIYSPIADSPITNTPSSSFSASLPSILANNQPSIPSWQLPQNNSTLTSAKIPMEPKTAPPNDQNTSTPIIATNGDQATDPVQDGL